MYFGIKSLYVYERSVDLRKSIAGLLILLISEGKDLERGTGLLFYNQRRNRIKILYRDSVGENCLWQKGVKLFKVKGKKKRKLSESEFKLISGEKGGVKFGVKKSYF